MASRADRADRAILADLGGVLLSDGLPAVAAAWSLRLGLSEQSLLAAIFGGSDDQVLIGHVSESGWWSMVGDRLGVGPTTVAQLRGAMARAGAWDDLLVAYFRRLRGNARTAIVSNAWPEMRVRLREAHLEDLVDEVVLSCEVGCAKPDQRIYVLALQRLGVELRDALLIDDAASHVAAARSAGMTGHLHVSSADTIAQVERFLRREPNSPTRRRTRHLPP
jgi:putative hydrolase of the HAD superfamily